MTNEELVCSYKDTGSIDVRNQVVENNLALVRHIASKFYSSKHHDYEYEDFVSFGVFGLIRAVEIYDSTKKTKFSTFAYQKIYYSIIDELRRLDNVPRAIRAKINKVKKEIEEMESKYGCEVDLAKVAQSYELSATDICVLDGTYMCSTEPIMKYIYDKGERSRYYDFVFCGPTLRSSSLSQIEQQ